jgi:CTP synthase
MEDQKELSNMGGTMRLGAWACQLEKDSKSNHIYNAQSISERHRHRYEFNNQYKEQLFDDDFKIAGVNPDTQLVEVVENTKHPWFIGVQFHPEYKSTVSNPHPLFVSFIKAALAHAQLKK